MSDEIKDGFERLRELAAKIKFNVMNENTHNLALGQLSHLVDCINVLEAEVENQN